MRFHWGSLAVWWQTHTHTDWTNTHREDVVCTHIQESYVRASQITQFITTADPVGSFNDIRDARPQIWLVQGPPKKHLACMKCLYMYQYLYHFYVCPSLSLLYIHVSSCFHKSINRSSTGETNKMNTLKFRDPHTQKVSPGWVCSPQPYLD